ncbi:aminotransferase [Sphingomonas piscis]|uniref:Aminotransferase n=1 Tax=Sphingomonas piscis TaxID=2714943 RepID=A0A6G7YS77_9SPHN|nr:aminotransferase [Sphingomonas piscis]QIK79596.1 aminotransferase [Sphingomonas piscis]
MHPLYQQMPTSIFEKMSLAAMEHGAVNLGQGFPDFGWPQAILDVAAEALLSQSNQYAPSRGLPVLRQAVADHYNRHHSLVLLPEQVCITAGATEAIAAAIFATIAPGDEVILFTPAYDAYAPLIRRAGGVVREVALQSPAWRIDGAVLREAITGKTRAIVINNPHNPTGRLFDRSELEAVAAVAVDHDLIVISDEVWEHLLLDGQQFTAMASLPAMADRTIKCGSAGKIFSLTGWKVGWLVASPALATLAARAHQFLTFSSPPNLQEAVAFGLNEGDDWLGPMRQSFAAARDRMAGALRAIGYCVQDSAATYFHCVDLEASGIRADDRTFADRAVVEAGIAVVPLSAFAEIDPPRGFIRLCFAKRDSTIDAGVAALERAARLFR